MRITELYERYEIPPWLADHQLTVAGVAGAICTETGSADAEDIITACLLHDMGNIIKFNFDKSIRGAETTDVEHWKAVQQRFIATYGTDVHAATLTIIDDISVSPRVREILDAVGFGHSVETLASGDVSKMIAAYSDMRVAPYGVVSLEERLADLTVRYGSSPDRTQFEEAFRSMEKRIFSGTGSTPNSVTQTGVDERKRALKDAVELLKQ